MSEYRPRFVVHLRSLALGLAVAGAAGPLYAGVPTAKTAAMVPFTAETAAPARRQGMVSAGELTWQCQGSRCTISGAPTLLSIGSCQAVAREVGQIRSFASPTRALSAAELSQCNAAGSTGPAARIGTPTPAETLSPARTQAPKTPGAAARTPAPQPPAPPARFQPVNVTTAPLSLTGARFEPVNITTPNLALEGNRFQPVALATARLELTGARFEPVSISTATLLLEGRRFQPVSLDTQRLEITGNRFEPVAVRTGELVLTGTRFVPIVFTTPLLVLEGVR